MYYQLPYFDAHFHLFHEDYFGKRLADSIDEKPDEDFFIIKSLIMFLITTFESADWRSPSESVYF